MICGDFKLATILIISVVMLIVLFLNERKRLSHILFAIGPTDPTGPTAPTARVALTAQRG